MLASLLETLQSIKQAASFLDAAPGVLEPMLQRTELAIAESSIEHGRVLRAVAHLRSESEYRSIAVHEAGGATSSPAEQLASSNVWQWMKRHEAPIDVDVLFGRATLLSAPDAPLAKASLVEQPFAHGPSQALMMARGTTHLLVLPLFDERSALRGMVSLEVQARGATRMTLAWSRCAEELRTWLAATGPFLCALPPAPAVAESDPLLPVCGAKMAPLVRLVRVFAGQDETLLLTGPTGAGKSRLARFCHAHSRRAGGPFETVDLLSVPPAMQLAELVGWKKGAFTGASQSHDGVVTRASGGTLFLDEIDKLSLDAQAGLLRLLETKRYRPLGASGADLAADVRFIVSTNADLIAEVREGRFREDLFYRINVLAVRVPSLAERQDEIGAWAEHLLLRRASESTPEARATLADGARELLARARWPGNLRQLDNVVRRAFVIALADSAKLDPLEVTAAHVEASMASEQHASETPISRALDEAARALVGAIAEGADLELEDAGIFRAHVLAAAIAKTGEIETALVFLRRENLVKGRNHHKTVDRELERARAFYAALGTAAPDWLLRALAR